MLLTNNNITFTSIQQVPMLNRIYLFSTDIVRYVCHCVCTSSIDAANDKIGTYNKLLGTEDVQKVHHTKVMPLVPGTSGVFGQLRDTTTTAASAAGRTHRDWVSPDNGLYEVDV